MRRFFPILFFLLFCTTIIAEAQIISEITEKAESAVVAKKYWSAWNILHDFDPKNEVPEIVVLKTNLLINYFATSIMHQLFGLLDIGIDENIEDYRGEELSANMVSFDVEEILEELIEKHPGKYILHKTLAAFYYDVFRRYGENWLKDPGELLDLAASYYEMAAKNGVYDYMTWFTLGYIELVEEDYDKAVVEFKKAIELKADDATSYYNLAYAYLFLDNYQDALLNALKATELYSDRENRGDAARLTATIYSDMGDDGKAQEYLQLSNRVDPDNYYTLRSLLALYIGANDTAYVALTREFHRLDPLSPAIYNDLLDFYSGSNKHAELDRYLRATLSDFEIQPQVQGIIYLYIGGVLFDINPQGAIEAFKKSRTILSPILPENHEILRIIEQSLRALER